MGEADEGKDGGVFRSGKRLGDNCLRVHTKYVFLVHGFGFCFDCYFGKCALPFRPT